MKKILALLLVTLFLSGCAAQPTWETVEDILPVEPVAAPQQLYVKLPQDAVAPVFDDSGTEELYLCQDYTFTKQILPGGDLEKTLKNVCALSSDQLQLMQTNWDRWDRYDFVWTAATEEGLQLGRACILDDGNYHYVVSAMAGEEAAGNLQEEWEDIFSTCCLLDPEINLRNGS